MMLLGYMGILVHDAETPEYENAPLPLGGSSGTRISPLPMSSSARECCLRLQPCVSLAPEQERGGNRREKREEKKKGKREYNGV